MLAAIVLAAIVLTALGMKFFPAPFFWVGLVWAGTAIVIGIFVLPAARVPLLTVGVLCLGLALSELILDVPPELRREVLPILYREDALLGWGAIPSRVSRATAKSGDEVIYDVVYSIDAAGHRVAPPDMGNQIEGCIFVFADSFAFGEGVNDHETFPYRLGIETQGRFRVVNFSFSGYGAEHMLAMLEQGEVAHHPSCEPTHVIYAALPHHVLRAAGKTETNVRGPRYRLGADGVAQYVGTDWKLPYPNGWQKRIGDQLAKSRTYRSLTMRMPTTTESDIELYFAIVKQSFRLIERRWPNARRYVISWDIDDFYSNGKARFQKGLEATGATVLYIDDMLPGYSDDATKYAIHRIERHPDAHAYDLVARYLANRLLSPAPALGH